MIDGESQRFSSTPFPAIPKIDFTQITWLSDLPLSSSRAKGSGKRDEPTPSFPESELDFFLHRVTMYQRAFDSASPRLEARRRPFRRAVRGTVEEGCFNGDYRISSTSAAEQAAIVPRSDSNFMPLEK